MPERLALRDVAFHMRNVRTRMPFRYGAATLTSVPILHVSVRVELADGTRASGVAADILPPKWFDKDPAKSYRDNVDDLLFAARAAARAWCDAGRHPQAAFALWRDGYRQTLRAGDGRGLNHLTSGHGSTLMERAVVDAVGRARGRSYFDLLAGADNPLGIDLGAVLPEVSGAAVAEALPAAPSSHVAVRHTVGLADPIRAGDIAAADRLDDGLPQALEDYLRVQGLRYLKVKVRGDLGADLERLGAIAALLEERPGPGRYTVSLDGNEQYRQLDGFAALLAAIEERLPALYRAIAYVEQPLDRSVALDPGQEAGIRAVGGRKPMIIDESDGDLDAFARALPLGYRGVSTKNCKGLFKALANAVLARRRGGFLTAEDLMNLPVVPVHQDLTHLAALGIDHAERNGHHYVRGLDHLSPRERAAALAGFPGLYRRDGDRVGLDVVDGRLDVRSLQGPGLGVGDAVDTGAMVPLDAWRFESLA